MKHLALVLMILVFAACDEDEGSSLCEDVTCEGDGLVCGESDGECHCGSPEGPVCGEEESCDVDSEACIPTACVDVVCDMDGTVCWHDGECHCGDTDGPVCSDGETCDAENSECLSNLPDPICTDGTRWSRDTQAFAEVTEEWGLTGVTGTRLSLADIDGDGYVDLLARHHQTQVQDFRPEGSRTIWLLRNVGGTGFEDVTQSSGILAMRTDDSGDSGRPLTIAAFADVDNDGDIDAFTGTNTTDLDLSLGEQSELLLNDGHGVFEFSDDPTAALAWLDAPSGASFVDVDRDGFIDLWVTQESNDSGAAQDALFAGNGGGDLTDITADSQLLTRAWADIDDLNDGRAHTHGWGAAACDLNGDGTPELLSPSYGRAPNHLWQGVLGDDGEVTFENRSVASGYAHDDNFVWQEDQFAMCYCRDNPTAEGCDEVDSPSVYCQDNWDHDTGREPFRLGGNSGSTFCADINNDGNIDLLTSEIRHWWAGQGSDGSEVLVNNGEHDVVFDRPGDEALGLALDYSRIREWDEGHMSNAVFDFDNDGWLDIYIGASDYPGNRGLLYQQREPLLFRELDIEEFFEHNRSHGVAFADFDRDGDLDVVVGHSRSRCDDREANNCYDTMQIRLFENIMDEGNWIQVHLTGGDGTNRAAIGARITVTAGDVTQTREIGGGFGHFGAQNDMVLHFGLGGACEAEVTIRWPDADLTEQTFTLPSGYRFEIEQGEAVRVAE